MATVGTWVQRLKDHCSARNFPEPTFQDVSDRRGGRTAWSTIATVAGQQYPARFWYAVEYVGQAKEDAAEVALRQVTGCTINQDPPPASWYAAGGRSE